MKSAPPATKHDRIEVTRRSLVDRLVDLDDQRRWKEFFDTYWRLIYGVARKSGLTDAEAQDVVQETVITVAKNITKYERAAGSFKGWLLHITRWRIVDQFRRRAPADVPRRAREGSRRGTATIERVPGGGFDLDEAWEQEWQRNLLAAALEQVKKKVSAKQFQIFDCAALKLWPAAKVAKELSVNIAQVYLAKHRVSALLKKEVGALERAQR